jgi:serine/threonine protein kinase
MEYLEGETLAARLHRGPLSFDQALAVATQIADALDKAHRKGIVHRDLKPGNVMLVGKAGGSAPPVAKLLDFGLAKLRGPAGGVNGLSAMPTEPRPLTAAGAMLGTFHYMAPEQIDGEGADARTDLFAFGAVLFEMLTGRRAFEGKTQASLFGAILRDQPPPFTSVHPTAPPALDQLLRACLAKDPDERIQTAHDVLLQLRWITQGSGHAAALVAAPAGATAGSGPPRQRCC